MTAFVDAPAPLQKFIIWRGKKYEVPSLEELQEWMDDGGCETPDGEWVEPDAPESWLRILGMI